MADPTLTIAWLILGHLLADFVFQTRAIAFAKAAQGPRAWLGGLAAHGAIVGLVLVPVALAFGAPGAAAVAVIAISHVVVDRAKIVLTRRAEARALRSDRHRSSGASGALAGPGWTPVPAALFVADQLVHAAILFGAWAVWLAHAGLSPSWIAAVDEVVGGWEPDAIHRAILSIVVIASLAVANTRGAGFFVEALVDPRRTAGATEGSPVAPDGHAATPAATPTGDRAESGGSRAPGSDAPPRRTPGSDVPPPRIVTTRIVRSPSPDRVGATIGVLERLLIVTFILTANQAAVGFVIAAKTLARFKQLDDREFAEYYLLGTLASVSIAVATGLVAAAALATIPG